MALLTVSTSSEWMTIVRYILGALLFGALFLVVKQFLKPDKNSSLEGIPHAPGGLPVIGHLHLLGGRKGENDATMYSRWSQQTKSALISCSIGDQLTVVVNTFAAVRDLWVGQAAALVDRPSQAGFLDKLGVDITGSPLTDQIRRCRAAALKALGKSMWPEYYRLLEPSSEGLIFSLNEQGRGGNALLDLYPKLRIVIFDLGLSLTYGVRYGEFDDAFMDSFLQSILDITAVRASTSNFRHYIRFLRWFPESTSKLVAAEKVRAGHVKEIYGAYQARSAAEGKVSCVVSSLGSDRLTEDEIHGTCLSLLQAAPDTVTTGIYQCVAWLSAPCGHDFQSKMYDAILEAYGGDKDLAWQMAFREERVPLVTSVCKESLRFFTVTPYSAPRQTTREVRYDGRVIPKGVAVYMNAQQANHDPAHFGPDAWSFNPERFVDNDSPLPHLSFGAGGRICPAMALSNRLMSAFMIRLTLAFELRQADPQKSGSGKGAARFPVLDGIHFSDVHDELVASPRHYDCRFVPRDPAWLQELSLKSKAQ